MVTLLGPNGAGKTTTLEIIEGHKQPDSGVVEVFGAVPDLRREAHCAAIGILLQGTGFDPFLRLGEALAQRARYFREAMDPAECLAMVGLERYSDRFPGSLSGGELRRYDLAVALIGRPRLLFLDEPTTGFDPAARQLAWELFENLKRDGMTMLLTTHYLEEAELLADWVYVLQGGVITHSSRPEDLNADGTTIIRLPVAAAEGPDIEPPEGSRVEGEWWVISTRDVRPAVAQLVAWAELNSVDLNRLEVQPQSLASRYLSATEQRP